MENEEKLISTNYIIGDLSVSVTFTDEPMIGSTELIRSILLSSYMEQQKTMKSANFSVDKVKSA